MRYFRGQVKQYLLLFEGRTGSPFLTEVLAQYPGVLAETERLSLVMKGENAAAAQLEWARRFYTPPLWGPYRVRGFKTKLRDVADPAGLAALLKEKNVRILYMQRRNHIKVVVSFLNAMRLNRKTDKWNLYQEGDREGAMTVEFDQFDSLLKVREQREAELAAYVAALGRPTLTLYYEDLLQDQAAFLDRVHHFLGLRPQPIQARLLKNTDDDLRKVLMNFGELKAHYAGTAYHAMFDEVLVSARPGDGVRMGMEGA